MKTQEPDMDVNDLMSQIREASTTRKPVNAAPSRPQAAAENSNSKSASQERFNQQTMGVLQQLATVSGNHEQAIIQVQQNAVLQNEKIFDQDRRIAEQDDQIRKLEQELTTARRSAVYIGKGRLFVTTADGISLIVYADDLQITSRLIAQGVWDKPLTSVFRRFIKNDDAYLEIGTHVGYFTVLAAGLVGHRGKVHAFEPHPATFALLETNMQLNRCAYIAKLVQMAASNRSGSTTFHVFANNPGSSTLANLPDRLLDEWRERPTEINVACMRLDDHYATETLQFDFIKIDAEGAEPLIFEGGRKFFAERIKPQTIIALEYNPPAIQGLAREPRAFAQSLFDAGFNLWRIIDEHNLEPVTSADQLDPWCISELLVSHRTDLALT